MIININASDKKERANASLKCFQTKKLIKVIL